MFKIIDLFAKLPLS